MTKKNIYVRLLDEDIEVWRPVMAEQEGTNYRILDEDYDPDIETWEFSPDELVQVETITVGGEKVLGAVSKI